MFIACQPSWGIPAKFSSPTNYATTGTPYCVAVGDFNGDGKLDFVTANRTGNSVTIRLGNGDGSFGAATSFNVTSNAYFVATGDFNRDSKLDLAVANGGTNVISLMLGNGDGTFGSRTDTYSGYEPRGIAITDYNRDGNVDIVVANVKQNAVTPRLGMGDGTLGGTLTQGTILSLGAGTSPTSVAFADFNSDQMTDMVTANANGSSVSVFMGQATGTFFSDSVNYTVSQGPQCVITGDFNEDGKADIATANFLSDSVSILLGNGDGTFQNRTNYGIGSNSQAPYGLVAADFNGDGHLDIATANTYGDTVSVLYRVGNGSFFSVDEFPCSGNHVFIASGDFNQDGQPDLIVANNTANTVSVLLNQTKPKLRILRNQQQISLFWPTNTTGFYLESSIGDFEPNGWVIISNAINATSGSEYFFSTNVKSGASYFRLRKP